MNKSTEMEPKGLEGGYIPPVRGISFEVNLSIFQGVLSPQII